MFTESERGYVALKKLEEETTEGGIWIVRTLSNLGNTIGDIRNELGMLLKRGIVLLVVEFPTMNTYRSKKQSTVLLSLLNEVYTGLQGVQINDIPMHPLKAGRKKAIYPEGWEELYSEWKRKNITTTEFLRKSGLKKATFYNLLGEYRLKSSTFSKMHSLKDISG